MHIVNLLLLAINSVKKFMEIDYMEYANDAAAQAAYVSSDTAGTSTISNADINNEDMSDITDWTGTGDPASGGGAITQVTFDSKSCMKLDSQEGGTEPQCSQDIGTFGARTVFSVNLYHETIGTKASGNYFLIVAQNGTTQIYFMFATDGLYTFDGATWNEIGTDLVVQDTWQEWTFDVDWTAKTMNVYLGGILTVSNIDVSYDTAGTNGYIRLDQAGASANQISYVDWFKAGSDFAAGTPNLQSYSEATIKQQGSYSLKGIALITDALNDTLIRTLGTSTLDLSLKNTIRYGIYASRTGSNIKLGFGNNEYATTTTATITCGTVEVTGSWTSATTAVLNASDNSRATYTGTTPNIFQLSDFNFGLPADCIILGIEVRVEFSSSQAGGYPAVILCRLSYNDGSNWSSWSDDEINATTTDSIETFGGSTDLWGRSWTPAELADGTFRLAVAGYNAGSGKSVNVDKVDVKIYYGVPTLSITMEHTPNILTASTFQICDYDISAIADGSKDYISQIVVTILNADAENTFYIDNLRAR